MNKTELLSGSECSNVSESSQGFNTCLHSDDNYFSKSEKHIPCDNSKNYNSLCETTSCSERRKVNNVIGSHRGSSECNNSSITFDNSFNKIVRNSSNERTNIKNKKCKHINNKNVTVVNCSCNDRSVSDVVSTHNEQSSSLNGNISFVTKNHVYCNKNSLFNDLETDDFNSVMNIDKIIPNNINLSSGISSNYLKTGVLKTDFECHDSFNEDSVSTIKEEPINLGIKENISDLNNTLGTKYNFGGVSNIDNLQNISLFVDFEHEIEINSKEKSLNKHVVESRDYIDTKILSTISSVNNSESVSNPEKMHSPSKLVCIDLDKCKVKPELMLLDNNESADNAVKGDASVITDLVPILKHKINCDFKSNPRDDNSLNVNHEYSENSSLNTVVELKTEPKTPDSSNIKIEATCNTIIKEEILEIEDCYSNWIEEVVIDTDCDIVENYSTVIDSVHGIDVTENNCKDIIIKTEPLSPDKNDLTFCSDEKQNSLKDGYQDVLASTENQFDGLTNSIEDFLNSTIECHLGAVQDSKNSFNLSPNITENCDLENIDERLSSIAEILPKTKTYLSSEDYVDRGSKNMMEKKLDNTVLDLPSLDCFQNYFSNPVESNGCDFEPTTIIPEAANDNTTHSLRAEQLNTSDMELQIKDMPINKELKTNATLLDEVNNISVSTIPKSPQTITIPRINKLVSSVSKTISNPPILSTKPIKIKPKKPGNLNTLTPGITVPKLVKINSAGIYTLPTNSTINSSAPPITTNHERLKHVKVVFKSKDGIISSTPKGLQNGSFILKYGQPVLLQSNGQVHKEIDSVSIPNKPCIILPYRAAVIKKDMDTQFRCSYVPPVKALTNVSVNGNKQTSVLRTIKGVSLLKKNLVVMNGASSVITNNLSAPSLVPDSPLKTVNIYSFPRSDVLPSNGTIVKEPFQSSKTNVTEIDEEKLMMSFSSPSSNKLSQRKTQVPVLLKKLSPMPPNVTGTLQTGRGRKIMVLNRTESKKMNFDGRITQLQNSLE